MSVIASKAGIHWHSLYVRFVPVEQVKRYQLLAAAAQWSA
jgi:hypothetical protein